MVGVDVVFSGGIFCGWTEGKGLFVVFILHVANIYFSFSGWCFFLFCLRRCGGVRSGVMDLCHGVLCGVVVRVDTMRRL